MIVYTDQHDGSFGSLSDERAEALMWVWRNRYAELGARDDVDYVMIFENRGVEVGVTLHHPHGQVYGYPFIPPVPEREFAADERLGGCAVCELLTSASSPRRSACCSKASASSPTCRAPRAGRSKRTSCCASTARACSTASRSSCVSWPSRCRRSCVVTTRCSSDRSRT